MQLHSLVKGLSPKGLKSGAGLKWEVGGGGSRPSTVYFCIPAFGLL